MVAMNAGKDRRTQEEEEVLGGVILNACGVKNNQDLNEATFNKDSNKASKFSKLTKT